MIKLFVTVFLLIFSTNLFASQEEIKPYKKHTLSVLSENDMFSFFKIDRYYTNGARIGYTSYEYDYFNEDNKMSWAKNVSIVHYDKPHLTRFNISLNQEMYTASKHGYTLVPNDHLFAGFLYLNMGIFNRTYNSEEHIGVKVGITGPYSFAEYIQTALHAGTGQLVFQGWHNQIDTEFIFNPYYQYTGRAYIFKTPYISMDFLGTFDIAAGNLDVHFGGYGLLRLGHNLDVDFGPSRMTLAYDGGKAHSDDFSFYIFAGGGPRVVLYNIYVQGNSPITRKGYDINFLRLEATLGFMFSYKGYRAGYVWSLYTSDYKQQPYKNHSIGGVMLEFSFKQKV